MKSAAGESSGGRARKNLRKDVGAFGFIVFERTGAIAASYAMLVYSARHYRIIGTTLASTVRDAHDLPPVASPR
jgi:hypothetical protein